MSGTGKRGSATKQKWTDEEEAALRAGVEKYDVGKWRHIQKDEELGPILKNRSNVDLKDKWRNLNMDSAGARRDGRGGGGGDRGRRKRKKRDKAASDLDEDDDADYVVAGRMRAASRRRRLQQKAELEEAEEAGTGPEPTPEPVPVTEESILAAMIQLQDPAGSDADAICQWLEDNYGVCAAGKRSVKAALRRMQDAGRITHSQGLYRLAGIPQQLVEESTRFAGEEDPAFPFLHHSNGSKTAREAAEAAARAVQEAEEAAELAAELIAAADRFDRETPIQEQQQQQLLLQQQAAAQLQQQPPSPAS